MPYAFAVYTDSDGPAKIGLLYMRYLAVMILLALLISLGAPIVIKVLASASYADAADLVPLVAIAAVFYSAASLSDIGILIAKRTQLKPLIFAFTATLAVGWQCLLTPRFGLLGAVAATALSYIGQYVTVSCIARRLYRFHVDSRVMLLLILAAAGGFFLGKSIAAELPGIPGALLATCLGAAVYGAMLHFTKLLRVSDLLSFARQFRTPGRMA
jgi:O-antigen/teichoic acid export membrane protein